MVTRCKMCRKKIDFMTTYCSNCSSKIKKSKETGFKDKEIEKTTKTARWQSLRKQIILRDKGVCKLCLAKNIITYKNLQVHHIIKRVSNPELIYEPTNLVTLCRNCHKKIEDTPISIQENLFGKVEQEGVDFRL